MKTKAYRGLDKLAPAFRKKVELFLAACPEIFVTESWRSGERQTELVKLKLSFVKRSNHQDGLAIDIGFDGPDLYPVDQAKWRKVADVAKKYGIDWGFDLWNWDKPHFQDNGLPLLLTPEKTMTTKYGDILDGYVKGGYVPVFSSHEGSAPLSEADTKALIDIGIARAEARTKKKAA